MLAFARANQGIVVCVCGLRYDVVAFSFVFDYWDF